MPLGMHHEPLMSEFLAEFESVGELDIPGYFGSPSHTHEEKVRAFASQDAGEGLPPGIVPSTTLFLIVHGQMVGVVNVRHSLNDNLRRLGGHVGYSVAPSHRGKGYATSLLAGALTHLALLGVTKALLTCDPRNVASVRVIEKNGGEHHETQYVDIVQRDVSRFWIAF